MLCLGIESSCDETGLALVRDGSRVDAVLASQVDIHALFDGVVPELASREHYRFIGSLYDALMKRTGLSPADVDVIAVTRGPGLLGSLLVGVAFAKGLALGSGKKLIGVNHLHAHLLAAGLERKIPFPALGLLVSGGHTHIYRMDTPISFHQLGRTIDDAAGEACDKFAKMLGLPYPGGVLIDRMAQRGEADPHLFPRPYTHVENLDFSFSGLKTAASCWLAKHPDIATEGKRIQGIKSIENVSKKLCDGCASFMFALADTLRIKLEMALNRHTEIAFKSLLAAGGVAANTQVRIMMAKLAERRGLELVLPSPKLCTDNGLMVAYMGWQMAKAKHFHDLSLSAIPRGHTIPEDYLQA